MPTMVVPALSNKLAALLQEVGDRTLQMPVPSPVKRYGTYRESPTCCSVCICYCRSMTAKQAEFQRPKKKKEGKKTGKRSILG